jgi:hypothetical protein
MIQEILARVAAQNEWTMVLRKIAKYYPQVISKNHPNGQDISFTTLVRIKRDDVWYVVHLVHTEYSVPPSGNLEHVYQRMMLDAHLIQNLYIIDKNRPELSVVDALQIDEKERLYHDYHIPKPKS